MKSSLVFLSLIVTGCDKQNSRTDGAIKDSAEANEEAVSLENFVIKPDSQEALSTSNFLESVVLPDFDVNDAPISDVLDALTAECQRLSPRSGEPQIKFKFDSSTYVDLPKEAEPKVTLVLKNTSVYLICKVIAYQAGTNVGVEEWVVFFRTPVWDMID